MACQILVSNISSVERTEIIIMFDGDHVWGSKETMQSWIAAGNTKESWDRVFSLVIITDKTLEELSYLTDTLPNGNNKYHFNEPPKLNPICVELLDKGQVSLTFDVASEYIIERT